MRGALGPAANTASVLLVAIASWVVAAELGLLASGSHILIFILANLILSFDMVDLIVRIWLKRLHGATALGPSTDLALAEISNNERAFLLNPYAVIASIHNEADEIDRFLQTLLPFKDLVWLIDDASNDGTSLRLRRDGWNCVAANVNRKKPGSLAHLLKALPSEVETVVILDPDTRWTAAAGSERSTLERVISDLQRSGAAALTPRIQAARGGWLVECQALEYELSLGLGRKSLRDLNPNSGVSIYRRSALEDALARHSLSVYAEDLENSLLLLSRGERIYYDDRLRIETDVKRTWRGLFSQRVGWSFGGANLFVTRLAQLIAIARRSPLGAYQYIFYLGLNGIVLLPLKLFSTGILALSFLKAVDDLLLTQLIPSCGWNDPLLFALWYLKSTLILLVACLAALPPGERSRHLATVPFYGLYALLLYLPMTVGYLNVLTLRLVGRRIYSDHYDVNPTIAGRSAAGLSVSGP
jgi:cellulose synthase/poly-beta-1,6-N-acetylglucosamine synthase-like glycosyltransferase